MTANGWIQIVVSIALVIAAVKPLGLYMARVLQGERTPLDPVLRPVERGFYRLAGIDAGREQSWQTYTLAMLAFSLVGVLTLYALQRVQHLLPLNPAALGAVGPDLAFSTATSFVSNTNWQAYAGESTMTYLTQMAGLTVHNFVSAATGIALAAALVRGFARAEATTLGNFWVDLTRVTLFILLPLAIVTAVVLAGLGVPQNLGAYVDATTLEGAQQTIAQGPVASQIAIKQLGTNGGGFFNANSAHPYENPTPLTNVIEAWSILAIAGALTWTFGRMVGDVRQGWALLAAMTVILVAGVAVVYVSEAGGNPILTALGVDPAGGNMEGKEVRFGLANSAIWVAFTTAASNGSVNAMHDSLTPLGGLVALFNIQLGEIVFGGVGSGLYGMLLMAIVAVFVAGLMVGRTPEYLGKKIEAREVKLVMLALLILPAAILGLTAVSAVIPAGLSSVQDSGPHGFSEILYAFTSAVGNNGSAFAGLNANTPWYNTTQGLAMLTGRFAYIVPMMAVAGALAAKKRLPPSAGTFPTHTPLFVGLLVGVIVIVGGLTFFPALALGPLAEHFAMWAGKTF